MGNQVRSGQVKGAEDERSPMRCDIFSEGGAKFLEVSERLKEVRRSYSYYCSY